MRSDLRLWLACIGLVFTLGDERAKAASGPFAVTLDGNIIHIASGFSFPNKIGKFQRVMTRQYDTLNRGYRLGTKLIHRESPRRSMCIRAAADY